MTKEERLQKYLQENPEVQLHKVRKKRVKQTAEEKRFKHMLYSRLYRERNLEKVRKYEREYYRKRRGKTKEELLEYRRKNREAVDKYREKYKETIKARYRVKKAKERKESPRDENYTVNALHGYYDEKGEFKLTKAGLNKLK